MTFANSTVSASYSVKGKQGIDRKSSIERSCRFGQSSGKTEATTISVTSLYLLVSKGNQLKSKTDKTLLYRKLMQCNGLRRERTAF